MKREETTGNLTILPINWQTVMDRKIVDAPLDEVPPQGMFYLSFNNKRRQKNGLQTCHCQGTLYETGHVHLDTNALQCSSFDTLDDMEEYLKQFGCYHISWLRGE